MKIPWKTSGKSGKRKDDIRHRTGGIGFTDVTGMIQYVNVVSGDKEKQHHQHDDGEDG